MNSACKVLMGTGLALAVIGCHSDRPHEYGQERPPVDQLDSRDKGLQSKDVVSASEQMAMDLLALPEMNASKNRWLIVVDRAENMTADGRQNLDLFLERLRVRLAQQGRGRVQLVENRDKLRDMQSRELDGGGGDAFGQGGGGTAVPARIQPDFSLYARIMEMPNRATSYFNCQFTLTDLRSGLQIWNNQYEVKVLN